MTKVLKPKKTCHDCGEKKAEYYFALSKKPYTNKAGETTLHEHRRRVCKSCESRRRKLEKVAKEAINCRVYNSGTAVSIRTVLHTIKRQMAREESFEMRFAWAAVGMQLNNLLLKI